MKNSLAEEKELISYKKQCFAKFLASKNNKNKI